MPAHRRRGAAGSATRPAPARPVGPPAGRAGRAAAILDPVDRGRLTAAPAGM